MFWEFSSMRRHDMGVPQSLEPDKLVAWCHVLGYPVSTADIEILLQMDRSFRDAWGDESTRQAAIKKR